MPPRTDRGKKPSQRRSNYSDDIKAWVYVTLQANSGNVYKTAKETGLNESTIRAWVKKWETDGIPEVVEDKLPEVISAQTDRWSTVKNIALDRLLAVIPMATERQIAALANVAGMAEDKLRMIQGLPTQRTETVATTLPSAEAVQGLIDGLVTAHRARTEEIDESDIEIIREEQAPKGLPEGE